MALDGESKAGLQRPARIRKGETSDVTRCERAHPVNLRGGVTAAD